MAALTPLGDRLFLLSIPHWNVCLGVDSRLPQQDSDRRSLQWCRKLVHKDLHFYWHVLRVRVLITLELFFSLVSVLVVCPSSDQGTSLTQILVETAFWTETSLLTMMESLTHMEIQSLEANT